MADLPSGIATLRNVLGERATFIHADTIDAALKSSKSANMIVCVIHFDDSRMFDLLRLVKADSQSRSIPFLCYRDLGNELPATLFESLEIACKALGAAGFVDVHRLKQEFGVHRADQEFARLILRPLRIEEDRQ